MSMKTGQDPLLWRGNDQAIPVVDYNRLLNDGEKHGARSEIYDSLLKPDSPGFIRVENFEEHIAGAEEFWENIPDGPNPLCGLLKLAFGAAFDHPRRPGQNTSANLSTREGQEGTVKRKPFPAEVTGVLLAHTDVPHYINPLVSATIRRPARRAASRNCSVSTRTCL